MEEKKGILDDVRRTQSTLIFESNAIKDAFKTEINKAGSVFIHQDVLKAHTLTVEFSLDNLTQDEIVNALVSTTSFMKQFQNNVLKHWSEETILEECQSIYKLSVRSMLDERAKQNALPVDVRVKREIERRIAKGENPEDVIAKVESMIEALKAQQ